MDQNGDKQIRTHESPMGGTMRLGEYPFEPLKGSKLQKAYGNNEIYYERHRHRYEANPKYKAALEEAGMIISGQSNGLIEAVELKDHPWFVGVQFHPEFTSHCYLFDQNSRAKLRTFSQSVNSRSLLVSVLPPVIFMISWMMRVCHQL